MTRAAAVLALALVLAGCGGAKTAAPPIAKPPRIPHLLAQEWIAQANAVAQALADHDGCTAVDHANALRAAVTSSEAKVPARLRTQLLATVNALPARITCNPAPPKPHPHPHPDHHHDHGHDHGKGGKG